MPALSNGNQPGFPVVQFPKCYAELDNPYRHKILYGGRGAARSWTVSGKLLIRGAEKPLLILCTRELQKSIKGSVYRLLVNQIKRLGLEWYYPPYLRTTTSIKSITGTEFMFLGTRYNPDEIRSLEGVDIVWIEEAHNLTEDSWAVITPTIRRDGSEIWATFNTRYKSDTLFDIFVTNVPPANSVVIHSNFDDNPFLPQVLQDEQAEMKIRDYEGWLHTWMGQLRQLAKGAVFGKAITELKKGNRLIYIPIEKSTEVETFNDIGKSDPTAFWMMQNAGGQLRFIDFYMNRFEDVDHYVKVLKALRYNYGRHWMPHDADHDRLGMTRNIKEQFEDGGIRPIEIVPRVQDKDVGIQQARDILAKCWFHQHTDDKPEKECEGYLEWLPDGWRTRAQRCERGFELFCQYRYKYNPDTQEFGIRPHHDIASNVADAFMQFAQSYEPPEEEDWFNKPLPD
jgi:phage terminase large subunit